jgi:hypothetical protein
VSSLAPPGSAEPQYAGLDPSVSKVILDALQSEILYATGGLAGAKFWRWSVLPFRVLDRLTGS